MAKGLKTPITQEEFAHWYSPKAVQQFLANHLPAHVWRPLLVKRLLDEDVIAAARKVNVFQDNRQWRAAYPTILSDAWIDSAARRSDADFWQTGDIHLAVETDSPPFSKIELSCVDVRFDPEGIKALVPAGIPAPTAAQQQNAESWGRLVEAALPALELMQSKLTSAPNSKPVSLLNPARGASAVGESEIRAWFSALPAEDQVRGFRWLWEEVRRAFFPRRVLKKHILPIVEGRPKGRPRKNVP